MNKIIDIAKAAARQAGELLLSMQGKITITEKGTSYNIVTEADLAAEKLIRDFVGHEAPGSLFLGEESDHDILLNADRLWIVDPLDGTTNFAHGLPHFAVSIAYAEKGKIMAGVVYDPAKDELFEAEAGGGAFCNGEPIHVSPNDTLSASLIGTGFYYDRGETMEKTLAAIHGLFKKNIRCIRRIGTASLDLSWVACGRFEGYFEYTLSPWDFAAGILIVNEAGGRTSDTKGKPADINSAGLICSNGLIHEELLACTLNPGIMTINKA